MRRRHFPVALNWINAIFSKSRVASRWATQRRCRLLLESLEDRLAPSTVTLGQQAGAPDSNQFHFNSNRSGYDANETVLTPSNVASGFGQVWESPVLDGRLYATPLYEDSITVAGPGNSANHTGDGIQSSSFQNQTLGLIFAATGGGTVYAIAAQDTNGTTGIAPGTIVWKTHLGNPYGGVDGNQIGVLSTPIIDMKSGRIYVTASVTDYLSSPSNPNHGGNNWEVFALNIADGSLVSGWPLIYTQSLLDSINQNTLQSGTGPKVAVAFSSGGGADQRGALALSPDGSTLYVDFACYGASNPGWMTTVATGVTNGVANGQTSAIASAYSAVDTTATNANGGMWGAGGPAIDANGNVFVSTGDSPGGTGNPLGDFGNSVLEFGPGQTLTLTGIYTPWNYQDQDTIDSDLGGGSPILLNLPAGSSTTTELLATGGKQGNGYLLDAGNNLNDPTARSGSPASYPADLTRRPPSNVTPSEDPGLYDTNPATGTRTYFTPNQVGPLSLFGPYNESSASGNTAKARDTPASFVGPDGSTYVIWAGASKAGVGSSTPVAPSLYLTKVVATPGQPAYLQIVAQNTAVMSTPGASIITGNGTANEIDWIVDAGVQRTDSLANFANGAPVLYAYNALTMQPIWNSAYEELDMGGKYNSITAARGDIFVGTDRIQAFGLTGNTIVDDSVSGTGTNQFNYVGTGWSHLTGSATMGTYNGTVSVDNTQGDYATLSFSGSQIKVYANELPSYGSATISVDGGNTQTVPLTPANSSPNGLGSGDVLVYNVSGLSTGTHTLKILNNALNNIISIDRVEIAPPAGSHAQLGISLTDGGTIPSAGAVIPYTINFNNAGSIVNNTGTNASGVSVTETVPSYSTFDASNSTPGWVLKSGNGGAGSTYTFSVGALNAGVTGSVVFSVDLASSIPSGTTSITNTVSITDSAADTASGSRQTPVPPAQEIKLVYLTQPPSNGGANVPLSPPIVVAAQDQFGNTFTADSSSTVTLTLNGGTFAGGGNTATAVMSNGESVFSNLIIGAAGTYTMTATDGSLASATSAPFTLSANSKLGFVQQPTQTVAGVAVSPAISVAVEDQSGHTVTTDTSTVTLTINQGSFSNGSTTMTAQAVNGVATFSNLVIDTTGSYTLIASDGNLTTAQSNSFNIVATATKLVFTQQPNNGFVGEAINPSVAVALEDQFGNVATGNTSTVTLTLSSGTLFGGSTTASAAAANGIALFNNLVPTAAGTYTLSATDGTLSSAVSASFTLGTATLTTIDDNNANNTGSIPTVSYSPAANWVRTSTTLANNFDGTVTTDSTGGDSASVTFTGTLVTLYAAVSPTAGSAAIFIDGGSPTQVNLTSSATAIAPVYTSNLLTAGSHTIEVQVVSGSVGIDRFVVGPATPGISWSTPADLVYGSALDGTQLDAFVPSGVAGSFTYSPAAGTVLHAGALQPLTVTFKPTDTSSYGTAAATVYINVDKSTPVITWPEPPAIPYGTALGSAQLDATANVPGTFVYNPGNGTTFPTQDDNPLSVTFTPTDTADYNTVTYNNNIDVIPATPTITWPNPAAITDSTPLSSTQLDATASVPGTFTYSPAAGSTLAAGQNQPLGVVFTPTDTTDYNTVGATAYINVNYGPATSVGFIQQPTPTPSGVAISPAVTVAVKDAAGATIPTDSSTVTLTLSTGTFVGGSNTVVAAAVNGIATFNNLVVSGNGQYQLTATDGTLNPAVSNTFTVGSSAYIDFNSESTDFTGNFATNSAGVAGGSNLTWGSNYGVSDASGGAAGGGLRSTSAVDQTAVYTPVSFNLSDGNNHTVSEFVTAAAGLGTGDRVLQIGFLTSKTAGFNTGFSFISARLLGNHSVEFQSANGGGATTIDNTLATGTINTGDWLQLILTTKETASGSFSGTFSLLDYGPLGTAAPTAVLAPTPFTVTGLSNIGTGATVYAGFRTATGGGASSIDFDNFAVDQTAAKMAYLQAPTSGTAGTPLSPFVAAVEDLNGHIIAGDSSTVTLSLGHGTFANGATTVSATAVNGIATFTNLQLNVGGSYTVKATDSNPNLDPGYDPLTLAANPNPSAFVNFNNGATDFTSQFSTNNSGVAGGVSLAWGAAAGINDNTGGAAGGGITSTTGAAVDETAIYTPTTFNLADGDTHTVSEFVTAASGLNSGDRSLQIGFATTQSSGFNAGFSFISARIYGDHSVEFQSANGGGAASIDRTTPTGTIAAGDWLQLVFTTRETASGSFTGTFSLLDYGPTGAGAPVTVLAPVTYTVTGLTNIGTGSSVYAGFRTATGGEATSPLKFDNFAVDPLKINAQPGNQTITSGGTATFTAAASGATPPTVQWYVSGNGGTTFTPIAGATSTTLNVNNVAVSSNNNEYEAIFSNPLATATTSAATLTVNAAPSAYVNFNTAATDFTSQFAQNSAGNPGGTIFTWNASAGVDDNTAGTAGGGVTPAAGAAYDQTAIYTPATFNLSDGNTHTISEFVTAAAGLNSGDRVLQMGFANTQTSAFNGGFSFISARLFGDHSVEFQSGNGAGTGGVSIDHTAATGTIANGDWLQLVFTTRETASGSFTGTFSLLDYGPAGTNNPVTVLGPVAYSVSGLTTMGTAASVYAGFRSSTSGRATSPLAFDNFGVDHIGVNSVIVDAGAAPIVSMTLSGTTMTVTTAGNTTYAAGQKLLISGSNVAADNGAFVVLGGSSNSDTFTFTDANTGAASTGAGGVVTVVGGTGSLGNGALGTSQRSMVDAIVYAFNQPVTLAANAFSIAVHSGQTGTLPSLSYSSPDGGTTWIITFSGSSVTGDSIADGVYDLTLNAAAVTSVGGLTTMTTNRTDTFFRLFGDANGTGQVTAADVSAAQAASGLATGQAGYLPYFDYNADGLVAATPDISNVTSRQGTIYSGFTATI